MTDISFTEKDPDTITREVLSIYEQTTGRTLARGDPLRLFLDAMILLIIQQRNSMDLTGKQNLLAYATGTYLDHIGALYGVTRLTPAPAAVTLQATLPEALTYPVTIPLGTRVSAGNVSFATTSEVTIPAGTTTAILSAECTEAGEVGNGFIPGQINKLVDVLPFAVNITNTTTSNAGTDTETDEALRERILIAPESFTTAGSKKGYEYYARSADSDILDVAVVGPPDVAPGHIDIYPLMMDGALPSQEVLSRVYESCNAEDVRPDTDYVSVNVPEAVKYALNITYWIDERNASSANYIRANVDAVIAEWVIWQRKALGRDLNPSELIKRVITAGAKRCDVASPSYRALKSWELAVCSSETVIYGGLEA